MTPGPAYRESAADVPQLLGCDRSKARNVKNVLYFVK